MLVENTYCFCWFSLRLWIVDFLVIIIIITNPEKVSCELSHVCTWCLLLSFGAGRISGYCRSGYLGLVACVGKGKHTAARLYCVQLPWPAMSYTQAGPVSPSMSLDPKTFTLFCSEEKERLLPLLFCYRLAVLDGTTRDNVRRWFY
jgi:hypothetical protein